MDGELWPDWDRDDMFELWPIENWCCSSALRPAASCARCDGSSDVMPRSSNDERLDSGVDAPEDAGECRLGDGTSLHNLS